MEEIEELKKQIDELRAKIEENQQGNTVTHEDAEEIKNLLKEMQPKKKSLTDLRFERKALRDKLKNK